MKLLSLLIFIFLNIGLFAQNMESDSTNNKAKEGLERLFSDNDIKAEIIRKGGRIYVNHYKYRFSVSPFISFYSVTANNPAWNVNSSVHNFSLEIKASHSITKSHKINLNFGSSFFTTTNKINYTHRGIFKDSGEYDAYFFNSDLSYSYLYPLTADNYLEGGFGVRLLAFDLNDKQIQIKDENFGYYVNFSFLRRLTEQFNLFFDVSYSLQKTHPTTILKDKLDIEMIQLKLGIQFLTIVSDMFYSPGNQ